MASVLAQPRNTHLARVLRNAHVPPLVVFDGETNQLVTAVLRPGNTHAGRGAVAVLRRVVGRRKEEGPGVEIEICADAGFALPAVYQYCEREGIDYTISLISNPRLETLAEPLLWRAKRESRAPGAHTKQQSCFSKDGG
jgi:hypothetical protein